MVRPFTALAENLGLIIHRWWFTGNCRGSITLLPFWYAPIQAESLRFIHVKHFDRYFSENTVTALRLLLSLVDFSCQGYLKESELGDYLNQIGPWLVFWTVSLLLIDVGGPPPGQMFLACRSKEDEQSNFPASFFFLLPRFLPELSWIPSVMDYDLEMKVTLSSPSCFSSVFCHSDRKQTRTLLNCLRMWLSGWRLDWCVQGSGLWSQAPGAGVQHIDVCKVYSNSYSITFFLNFFVNSLTRVLSVQVAKGELYYQLHMKCKIMTIYLL